MTLRAILIDDETQVVVPKEPSKEMLYAVEAGSIQNASFSDAIRRNNWYKEIYGKMIAAAPKPETVEENKTVLSEEEWESFMQRLGGKPKHLEGLATLLRGLKPVTEPLQIGECVCHKVNDADRREALDDLKRLCEYMQTSMCWTKEAIEITDRLRAVLQAPQQSAWQDIDSAPKDGTAILACAEGCRPFVCFFSQIHTCGWISSIHHDVEGVKPTHWMPLPQPQTKEKQFNNTNQPKGDNRMTNTLELAEKFCMWPLPETVCADPCATKQQQGRVGTNLLSVSEAKQFFDYIAKEYDIVKKAAE